MKKTHRKRRSIWIDITFSLAIITLTVAAIYLVSLTTKNEAAPSSDVKSSTAPSPVVVDTIDSNYPGIKIITETSNDPSSPFAIQYPQSIHSDFNEEISTYIKKAKKNYLLETEEDSQLGSELNISFETLPHHSGNYSFVLINSSFIGGANGSTEIRSFHLNPTSGKVISIEDIFTKDLDNLNQLTTLVRDTMYNDPSLNDLLSLEEAHRYTEPHWENYSNFAITDESLIFYFDEVILTAGSTGPPIIAIALRDINSLLADGFKLPIASDDKDAIDSEVVENNPPEKTPSEPPADDGADAAIPATPESDTETDGTETGVRQVALTFDDGPDPKATVQILETLEKYDAKATFFMLGSRVEYYPEIAVHITDAGHELGNHTWNHPDLTKVSIAKIHEEINRTSSIIEAVTGVKPTTFRPPYGAVNQTVRAQTDLPVILWDVDTLDWKHRDADQLIDIVESSVKDGSIILMHDIHQSTADGLEAVLAYLQSEGYEFVTVSNLK